MNLPTKKMPTAPEKPTIEQVPDDKHGNRVLFYGPGGIGKSTLACLAGDNVVFVDADESLPKIKSRLRQANIKTPGLIKCSNWQELIESISLDYAGTDAIIFDRGEVIQSWCVAQTCAENGKARIEDIGYGKGYRYVFDNWLQFLSILDHNHYQKGRNVIIICHDVVSKVANPSGQEYLRWEPALQNNSNETSIRARTHGWADHTLFYNFDISVSAQDRADKEGLHAKPGKATGAGIRILYTAPQPYFMAKSRTTSDAYTVTLGSSPWESILT